MKKLIIGTRGSLLALKQAEFVRGQLLKKQPYLNISLSIIKTLGDRNKDPLTRIGAKGTGIFVKEIEEALLRGDIDLAVHSLKDVPTQLPKGLEIAAVLKREEHRDAFISLKYKKMSDLPKAAIIGTSSLRRKVQIYHHFHNIKVVDIRGNVDTRLKKMNEKKMDGIVMSAVGLERLGLSQRICEYLSFVPAPAQGALCLEVRKKDLKIKKLISFLNDSKSFQEVELERYFLKKMGGGCQIPLGIKVDCDVKSFFASVFIGSLDGQKILEHNKKGSLKNAKKSMASFAQDFLKRGGKKILEEARFPHEE